MKIQNETQLRKYYGFANARATLKQLNALEKHSQRFIEISPFCILSTASRLGAQDASPRGGAQGFVKVLDNKTLLLPDAKGNNRLDSLINIIENKKLGLLFFIPGVDETLRINGRAEVSIDSTLLIKFSEERNPPISVIRIEIDEVFLHCAKAIMRAKLWSADAQINRTELPTMGQMINAQINDKSEPESQQAMLERYQSDL